MHPQAGIHRAVFQGRLGIDEKWLPLDYGAVARITVDTSPAPPLERTCGGDRAGQGFGARPSRACSDVRRYATLLSRVRERLDTGCPGTTKSESGAIRNVRQGIETSKKFGVFSCPVSARPHAGFRDSDGKWGQLWGLAPMSGSVLPPMRLGDVSIGKADRPIKPTLG